MDGASLVEALVPLDEITPSSHRMSDASTYKGDRPPKRTPPFWPPLYNLQYISIFHHQNGPPLPRKVHQEGWLQKAPCENYPREKVSPQKMRGDHRLDDLDGDHAYDQGPIEDFMMYVSSHEYGGCK